MVALLLALADSGIPVQTDVVPEPLLKKLQPGKISGFLCLGNVGSSVVRSLKRIATDMRFVAGDAEEEAHLPLAQIVELEGVRVGMTHGHMIMPRGNDMALDAERRRLNVDVLLSASTGRASTKQHGSGLLVDPGSITGLACSPIASRRPSFTLLSLDHGKVTTFTYSVDKNGAVGFQRRDFQRQQHGVVSRPQAAPSLGTASTASPPPVTEASPAASLPAVAAVAELQPSTVQTLETSEGVGAADETTTQGPEDPEINTSAAVASIPDVADQAEDVAATSRESPEDDDAAAPAGLQEEASAVSVPSLEV